MSLYSRGNLIGFIRRGPRKPPRVLVRRALSEVRMRSDRWLAGPRAARFTDAALLRNVEAESLDELWCRLARRPFCCRVVGNEGMERASAPRGEWEHIHG